MADDEYGGSPVVSTGEAGADAAQKDASLSEARSSESPLESPSSPRTFVSYTRPQILALYNSPLVKPLDHMPPMRDWFGEWPEQNNKSYGGSGGGDTLTLNAVPRDRRFRRDQDDSEPAPRATFRSGALSQPSQMGNFKHQSTRTSDRDRDRERDRDRDGDKERERDIRDREGQERLRSLSDKYDRDRLGSSTTNGLRGKDREAAPHLSVGSSRLSSGTALTGRRGEGRERGEPRGSEREREGGTRRKAGESIDDWRRGRDERSEPSRRDSSRHRDSSRTRRDPSTSRKDRNRDRDERESEYRRRDRGDRDREENDDPRRWRDDGKREERLAARRDRDREPRDRGDRGDRGERTERGTRDRDRRERNGDAWDTDRRDRDRGERNDRWTTEEREDRGKRTNGRERRGDDDKEERRDREKEKEPAWMETYVPPSTSTAGILGGKAEDGGLDGIQAWKKGMKEKEEKEKAAELAEVSRAQDSIKAKAATGGLDEIQMFKQMMKREEEKKKEGASPNLDSPAADAGPPPGLGGPKGSTSISLATLMGSAPAEPSQAATQPSGNAPQPITASTSTASDVPPSSQDPLRPAGSRFFPAPPSATIPSTFEQPQPTAFESAPESNLTSPAQQYNPPAGPRLLSLGARPSSSNLLPKTPSGLEPPPSTFGPTLSQLSEAPPPGAAFAPEIQQRLGPSEPMLGPQRVAPAGVRTQMSYPSYENQLRPPISLEDPVYPNDAVRHHAALERAQFGTPPMQQYEIGGPLGGPQGLPMRGQSPAFDIPERSQGGSPYQSKGSRFAKFFDGGKPRELPPQQMGQSPGGMEYGGQLPKAMQRLDIGGGELYNGGGGGLGNAAEGRTMEDLFQMLQNSTQRGPGSMGVPPQMHHAGGAQYNQQQLPMHMHQAERNPQRNLDMLYDNRLDDRNFVPDGMVPGLRSVPPPRGRDSAPIFRDQDDMAFNVQPRLPQQRGIDPAYGVPPPQAYPGQARNIPGQPYRNGVSPVPNQNALLAQQQQQQQQRLPPGLANLGGRPPHEPQFVSPGLQGLGVDPRQAQYGGAAGALPIGANGLAGYAGAPQMRGPPPPQQLPLGLGPNGLGGAGLPGKMDLRGLSPAQQAQLLGLGGGAGPDARRPSVGMAPPQVNQNALHAQQLLARQQALQQQQQQQQGLPQHMLPRMLPPHMQGGGGGGPIGQPAQDLMALLMHGAPRE